MKSFIHYYKKIFMRIILTPLKVFSVKNNRVFICNNLSRKYSGNPKYVTEYLMKKYDGIFDIIISLDQPKKYGYLKERGLKTVKSNSFMYFFYAMTSRVFLTNSGGFSYIPMRKSQIVINTHHGGGAYKRMGIHMYIDTPRFRRDLRLSADSTTVFLSTCRRFSEFVSESMLISREKFWEIGMPRNDILFCQDEDIRSRIRNAIGLNDEEKLVLFAPTYRKPADDYFNESISISYGIDSERVCKALSRRFGGKWKFAFRLHPCVVNRNLLPKGDIIDLSDYEEMQELLIVSDVMINDFSSSMWDFMLTGKPSFMFAVDMEHYIETTEVETPISEWPFPKAVNNDELEKNILEFDENKYRLECERHYRDLGGCETGKASELVGDYIYDQCFEKSRKPVR